MARALVIVESPSKAKIIGKYLGKKYVVKSSVGHIRDLPTSGKGRTAAAKTKAKADPKKKKPKPTPAQKLKEQREKLFSRMAINPEKNWAAEYEILPGKEKVVKELQKYAKDADVIYLATDLDREGEAIAWHLSQILEGAPEFKRIRYSEITKKAIEASIADPSEINIHLVHAQQARRFLDRVVGFMISPLLWAKVARGLSAGRVQSVAVRLIADREASINAFKPDEYWEVHVDLDKGGEFKAQVVREDGKSFKPVNEEQAKKAVKVLEREPYKVTKREDKPTKSKPTAPYITSTLQQASSLRLGFGVKKTMMLAQRLYEAGLITYMRTDSTNLSKDAVEECREYVEKKFGKNYLPEKPNSYSSKKNAQEAHEAIRPTNVVIGVEGLTGVEEDQKKLYGLIWRQFVACQMVPAEFDSTSLTIDCGEYTLRARGRVLRFDGFYKVQPQYKRKNDAEVNLPDIPQGSALKMKQVNPSQHFTKPPPRFTEASLVKELEKQGIGRPSTYASIISTIQDRGYVKAEKRRFFCLKMGEIVTERLQESFNELMDFSFTANLEDQLDEIANGEKDWKDVLNSFYKNFVKQLDNAKETMRGNDPTLTDIKCKTCERPMAVRTARTGVFLSCSGYALPPKERCKETVNLVEAEEYVNIDADDEEGNVEEIQNKRRCKTCDTAMNEYIVDEERKLHVCGRNPDCMGFEVEKGKFEVKGYEGPLIECDKCGKDMQLKTGRFGKYFGCTDHPECKNTRKLLRNGEAAPPRAEPIHMEELPCEKSDGYFILRDGAAGLFLASSAFPKSRETKKPLVEDLVRHKDKLDPKYVYITDAPTEDPDGNKTSVRFSRKAKEHTIGSELDGKLTGWTMVYRDGKWITEVKEKKAKKPKKKTD